MSGFALPEVGPPWNRHVHWMPLEAEAPCPCGSRPAGLWRRIERVLRPGMRYDLGDPSTETTLVVRPDLDNLTAGDLVRLGVLARHLDGAMKVELTFDDAEIEPNSYVLRDTSWQEYCPMPEMTPTSDSAGQEGAKTSSGSDFRGCHLQLLVTSDGCCSQHPHAQPDERQPVNHPTREVDKPSRHAGHEAGHHDGDRDASRNNTSPSARRPVHDPTDAEQHEAGQTPDDQPAPDERVHDVGCDRRQARHRKGLVPPVPGHEHRADHRRSEGESSEPAGAARLALV